MSFDIYFAGAQTPTVDDFIYNLGANRLYSYFSERKHIDNYIERIKTGKTNSKLIVDSGAFSAWTRGITINVDEYIEWLNERSEYITAAGQMDVIPGHIKNGATFEDTVHAAEGTWENYLYMRKRLKNPDILLYTFHIGEPIKFLKNALEWKDENGNQIKYMALGGMVGKPRNARNQFLQMCYTEIFKSSNPNIKVHAFGMTDLELCKKYPITSADSTTWIIHGAQGRIRDEDGRYINISEKQAHIKENFVNIVPEQQERLHALFDKFGFSFDELKSNYIKRLLFNVSMMYEQFNNVDNRNAKPKQKTLF